MESLTDEVYEEGLKVIKEVGAIKFSSTTDNNSFVSDCHWMSQ